MKNKTISRAVWIIICVVIVSKSGNAMLNIKPNDAVVLVNRSTFFNCSTLNVSSSSEEIVWYHYSVNSDQRKDVYEDGEIRTNYKGRFRVEKDLPKGIVNLIVQAPFLEDAGTYECQDRKGIDGDKATAQLIVLETEPVCQSNMQPDGVIGSNNCGREPDKVQLVCSVAYRGNIPVHLEWRNSKENEKSSLAAKCSNTTNLSTCNISFTGDHARNNSAYICQIVTSGTNEYSCSSDIIKILYATSDNTTITKTDKDEIKCSANSSQQCTYIWYKDGVNISKYEILKPRASGLYLCEANCVIRGQACKVTAMNVNVSVGEQSNAGLIAGIVISLVVIIIAIILIVVFVVRKKKSKQRKPGGKDGEVLLPVTDNKDGSNPPTLADPPVSADSQDAVISKVSDEDDVPIAISKAAYIDKGLSGEIYGPREYKGKQCAFERIMCSTDQQTPTIEGEMKKEEKICTNSRQWMELNHEKLIKFYDVVTQSPAVYIVMEYAEGGSVRKTLNRCKESPLPLPVVKDWAIQIAEGMKYLHENDIIHKSLKCAQVLIMEPFDQSTAAQVTLKLASYSLTAGTNTSNPVTFKGMFAWLAPEAIAESKHSKFSDIWGYGVTVWEILTREIPHDKTKVGQTIAGILSGSLSLKIPESCPADLRRIFTGCFERTLEERPTFGEILIQLHKMNLT